MIAYKNILSFLYMNTTIVPQRAHFQSPYMAMFEKGIAKYTYWPPDGIGTIFLTLGAMSTIVFTRVGILHCF